MNNNPIQTHPDNNQDHLQLNNLNNILIHLRTMRDKQPQGEIRSLYNIVCDRLDVLISKIYQENKVKSHWMYGWREKLDRKLHPERYISEIDRYELHNCIKSQKEW